MEPDAPFVVLQGTLVASSAGALLGGTYGIVKRLSPVPLAFNASINCGIAGLTFFALREYIAGPFLVGNIPLQTYTHRREAIQAAPTGQPAPVPTDLTFSKIRMHKLLDTTLAGSATGGILNAWRRGPRGVIPGAITAGIACTVAQFIWNELEVTRIKIVLRTRQSQPVVSEAQTPARSRTFSERLMDSLGVVFPIKKLSDEEYLQVLVKQRAEVERRLTEVREELEESTKRK